MRRTAVLVTRKPNAVTVRSNVNVDDLAISRKYRMPFRQSLSVHKFSSVNNTNRFDGLRLILQRLSSHVGRRQYPMNTDMTSRLLDFLVAAGIDWHDLKSMPNDDVIRVLKHDIRLSEAECALLGVALQQKTCGVVLEDSTMVSKRICLRPGRGAHGWRCGESGHSLGTYFENKPNHQLTQQPPTSGVMPTSPLVGATAEQPDFSVFGRVAHATHPRVLGGGRSRLSNSELSLPMNAFSKGDPVFDVMTMGIDFDVHPHDVRALPQIVVARGEWAAYVEAVRQALWEALEYRATCIPGGATQELEMGPGENLPIHANEVRQSTATSDGIVEDETGVILEQSEFSVGHEDAEMQSSRFRHAPPRALVNGRPQHLAFSPSVIIRSRWHADSSEWTNGMKKEADPLVEISIMSHPSACYRWPSVSADANSGEQCLSEVLEYARRVPFALPFDLLFRVDPVNTPDETFFSRRAQLYRANSAAFALQYYVETGGGRWSTFSGETPNAVESYHRSAHFRELLS